MKKITMIKSAIVLSLLTAVSFSENGVKPLEQSDSANADYLTSKVQEFIGKAGIQFSGEFKSRALNSTLGGNIVSVDTVINGEDTTVYNKPALEVPGKSSEDVLYTSVDFEVGLRPHDAVGGKVIIRMHEDWRNMFASMASPLYSRWISMDGNLKDMFFYSVGDYKVKYTPLTLWAPEPEIMYEPYIFSRQRADVMNETFAGDNYRVLQGVNLDFKAQIVPAFDEVLFNIYGTRLRKQGRDEQSSDYSGYRPTAVDADLMDRYSTGANLNLAFLGGLEVGGTVIYTGDAIGTYVEGDEEEAKALRSQNLVAGGRIGVGTGLFGLDKSVIDAKLYGEFISTTDIRYVVATDTSYDSTISGMATNGGIDATVALSDIGNIIFDGKFVYNSETFRNEMAQAPVLYKKTIMNSSSNLDPYSTFDVLYKQVFKYTPAETESGIKQPTQKIGWTRGIMTYDEIDSTVENGEIENYLMPVMPFGDATPNRIGADIDLGLELLNKSVLISGKFKYFNDLKAISADTITDSTDYRIIGDNTNKATYMQMGGGASIDVAKLGGFWPYPIVLSGSFLHSDIDEAKAATPTIWSEVDVNFVNGGLYFQFWKKAALIGGYQLLQSSDNLTRIALERVFTQTNWAGGLEYKVADGGTLTGTVGQVITDYSGTYTSDANLDAEYRDDYYKSFTQMQFDLFLTVNF